LRLVLQCFRARHQAYRLTLHTTPIQKGVSMALIIGIIIGALLVIFLLFRLLGWIF
jgi:hypothetical protein